MKKTVCIVIYRMGVGGAEQMVVAAAKELLRRGFAVRLVTLSPEREHSLMSFVPTACQRELIPFKHVLDWRSLRSLARLFVESNPEIIITQLWYANTAGRIAARIAGMHMRVLSFEQNVYDQVKSWKQYLLDRALQGWCAKIVAISESVRASLIRHGIAAPRILVIHNAIDIDRCTQAPRSGIREELGIANDFIYLFVGRLVRQKGVDVLLEAFARQEASALLIAGDGELRAELASQASALRISTRVFFLGVRHDIPSLMKASDCFVLASRWEGFGIVLAEALACGLPVVATHVDGIKEVIDAKSGILVAPEDIGSFATALTHMRVNTPMRASMAKHASERASFFSIEQHVSEVLACMSL